MSNSDLPLPIKMVLYALMLIFGLEASCTLTGCTFSPGGNHSDSADARQMDANTGDGGAVDGATDATLDASPLVAAILVCDRKVAPVPDEGVTIDRPIVITCAAIARTCEVKNDRLVGQSFPMVSVAENQWEVSLMPVLGANEFTILCQGDSGTAVAEFPPPPADPAFTVWATRFEIVGADCSSPGHCSVPSRLNRITLSGDMPGEGPGETCSASATPSGNGLGFSGNLPCPTWSHGPYEVTLLNGPGITALYTVTGPRGYRGTIAVEVPASQ